MKNKLSKLNFIFLTAIMVVMMLSCGGNNGDDDKTVAENTLTINVARGGKTASFTATFNIPTVPPPGGGDKYPVIVAFGGLDGVDTFMGSKGNPAQYALDNGYANIAVNTGSVAADGNSRTGAFYTLYPYAESQTGVLMAWAWGASKVLDALEAGAGEELGISFEHTMIQGTSRNGKAAAVAGAFEDRFKVVIPTSSGAGGLGMGRYNSAGQTYNYNSGNYFSYNSGGGTWTVDGSNPQSFASIKGDSGGGWFNSKFQTFSSYEALPFDQHFLAALCAADDRYLFMVNGFEWDKWTNVPGFFMCFEETLPVYELLGIPENLAVSMHRSRHGLEQEDMVKIINYTNHVWYGKALDFSGFDIENKPKPTDWNDFLVKLHQTPFSYDISPSNNAIYEEEKQNALTTLPDVLGGVSTAVGWSARREAIKQILQENAYGIWRSGEGETVTYSIN